MSLLFKYHQSALLQLKQVKLLFSNDNMYYNDIGMVFSVNLGFANLSNPDAEDEQGKVYALFIGDIVQVNEVRVRVRV